MTEKTWQELRDAFFVFRPATPNQEKYVEAIRRAVVTIAVGPAGVGKTLVACSEAARALRSGEVKKVVMARPLVACSGPEGHGVGYLPGSLEEKVAPYMRPLLDAFGSFFSAKELAAHLAEKTIEMLPLELMRGTSLKKTFILCDEAQNASYEQLYMLLTRFGDGSKVVVTGDDSDRQTDLKRGGDFRKVIDRIGSGHPDVRVVRLTHEDQQRHPLIQFIDARLSGAPVAANVVACPSCHSRCAFEAESDEQVEQVECCYCLCVIALWDDDVYSPREAARLEDGCLRSKPAHE